MSADDPGKRDREDWEVLETSANLDAGTARALRDLERIAAFSRDLQRSGTARGEGESGTALGSWGPLMLLERVGAGAHGEVWRAWDATLQRQVALKFLQSEGIGSDLVAEARALARVRHPGVVTVYGVAEHDGRTGMWMEWIEGLTLVREIERRGALPAREVARIGVELCAALEALEGAGVVHRDVKPANIVLESGGRVVLTDFGLGWRPTLDGKARASGTPLFMAPELLQGGAPSARSDLYALGVTLWWALAGRAPFQAKTIADLRQEASRGPEGPLRGAPRALSDTIGWAMKPLESERPRNAAQLRERLAQAQPRAGSSVAAMGWKIGVAAIAVAGLSWWMATRHSMDDNGAGHWTARQIPMPAAVQHSSDYALSPDGTKIAYVSDSSSALSVFSIDTNDSRVVDRLAPGDGSYAGVAWTSDGSSLVTSRRDAAGEGTELTVDPITGQRGVLAHLGKIDATELTEMMSSLSPDGRFLAVRGEYRRTYGAFHTIDVLDLRSGARRELVRAAGDRFVGPPVWNPGSTRLAYLLEHYPGGRIETCDLHGTRTTLTGDSTESLTALGSDSRTLLWLNDTRLLYSFRGPGEAAWRVMSVDGSGRPSGKDRSVYSIPGAAIQAPSLSRRGEIAFTAQRVSRSLGLIGTQGRPRYPGLSEGVQLADLMDPVWSPDGGSLFARYDGDAAHPWIGRLSIPTGRFERITPASHGDQLLCLTPDGGELLCVMDSRLVAVPVHGGPQRVLARPFLGTVTYASQAHRWLAVEHSGADLLIREFSPSGGLGAIRFHDPMPGMTEDFSPEADLSPDGARLVVLRGDASGFDILDAAAGRILRAVSLPSGSVAQYVRWSPDGKTVYASGMLWKSEYWIARFGPGGDGHRIWESEETWPGNMAISPDGSTVAFTAVRFLDELWILKRS